MVQASEKSMIFGVQVVSVILLLESPSSTLLFLYHNSTTRGHLVNPGVPE